MLDFIIKRPIAVLLTFIGLVGLGIVTVQTLPVSLLPDVPIPTISVQISYPNMPARTLENTIVKPIRQQLMPISQLKDIHSQTQDGSAVITLDFEFGTKTDYAFIEVNEQIDRITSQLPKAMERPRVVKANLTDIPVFYLTVTPQKQAFFDKLELGNFAKSVIKRRIEQLPEVAFADISGWVESEILIIPNEATFQSLGIKMADLEQWIGQNNLQLGNILIQDGQYQYNVRLSSGLTSKKDIEDIYININGRVLQLRDIAKVVLQPREERGKYLFDAKEGVVFSVRKQADSRLFDLQANFETLLSSFKKDYPQLDFYVTNDQTQLLSVSINNLKTSLLYGAFFAFIVMFLFFKSWSSPILIGIAIPVALVMTLLSFYFISLSINIISLSGLILGVGLMIDNSIIVIENIKQYRDAGLDYLTACTKGTNEVIRPLLSSALTTCSVFVPLIFVNGVSGALFYDQALSITLALGMSLITAYFLLPTLLYWVGSRQKNQPPKTAKSTKRRFQKSVDLFLKNRWFVLLILAGWMISAYFLLLKIPQQTFPNLTKNGLEIQIDWNESINLEENERRTLNFLKHFEKKLEHSSSFIGEQQFLLSSDNATIQEGQLFFFTKNASIKVLEKEIQHYFKKNHALASVEIQALRNVFDYVFGNNKKPLEIAISIQNSNITPKLEDIEPMMDYFKNEKININLPPSQTQYNIQLQKRELLQYNISETEIITQLKAIFNQHQIGMLQTSTQSIPIRTGQNQKGFYQLLQNATIQNRNRATIPLSALISIEPSQTYRYITSNKSGEALLISLGNYDEEVVRNLKEMAQKEQSFQLVFSGQYFEDQENIQQLWQIALIAVALLFLILAAQFESVIQPFIVLLTVPIGIAGAIFLLYFTGQTLNLMAMIGMVVMSGIVVNDAILKVDMINRLSKEMPLLEAIHEAGKRRLKPILMTSITTILALVPILFTAGLGAELQFPLAIAVIGGLTVGTLASLYIIPIFYKIL
jgi:multidrug efflux pump subunit AcrB